MLPAGGLMPAWRMSTLICPRWWTSWLIRIARVESLPAGLTEQLEYGGRRYAVERWIEHVETALEPAGRVIGRGGAVHRQDGCHYLAF